MHSDLVRVPAARLQQFMRAAFVALGVPDADAQTCSEVLVAADIRGFDTHGISRLGYYRDRIRAGVTRPETRFERVRETAATAVVDGHHGMGHVIAKRAMSLAMEKARATGLGSVAVRNSTHYGIAGYYAQMAAECGLVGLCTTNARPAVVPTFSTEPKFGTNPLAFGAPSDEPFPFLFDASMAVTQRGKLEVKRRQGGEVPEGLVIDAEGQSLRDAGAILDGMLRGEAAMLPLGGAGEERGGYKGYSLGIMLEILSSALQGGRFLSGLAGGDREGAWKPYHLGHFFLAIDVAAFTEVEAFKKTVGDIMRELRAARRAPGAERIWTAGEKEWETALERTANGIPLSPALQAELQSLQEELGLPPDALPFDG